MRGAGTGAGADGWQCAAGAGKAAGAGDVCVASADGRALRRGDRRVSGRTRAGGRGGKAREWGVGAPGRLQRRDAGAELLIACIALDFCTVLVYNYIRLRHEYILIRRRNCQNEVFLGYDDRTNSASDAS